MRQLSLRESFELLKKYDIPFTNPTFINDIKHLDTIRTFPCVMKIDSEDVIHKSDAGGIIVGIKDNAGLHEAYNKIMKSVRAKHPKARIHGVALFKQEKGLELFVGMKKDPQFGNVIAFGLGGIFVELLKDVSLRIAPFDRKEALKMINEIKASKVLDGARGTEKVDKEKVASLILKMSKLCQQNPSIVELDFNPILAGKETIVADVRIITQ